MVICIIYIFFLLYIDIYRLFSHNQTASHQTATDLHFWLSAARGEGPYGLILGGHGRLGEQVGDQLSVSIITSSATSDQKVCVFAVFSALL